jgi:hypothetical protein
VSCKLIIKHLIFLFYFSFTSPGFYSFTTPFASQNNAPDDEGLSTPPPLLFLKNSAYNTAHGRRRRRRRDDDELEGLPLLLGLAFLLFDPTRRVYNHVVCARSLGFFFFFFFFCFVCALAIKRWAATQASRVCVYM